MTTVRGGQHHRISGQHHRILHLATALTKVFIVKLIFYSKSNLEVLQASGIEHVILPKKGKLNKEDKQRESDKKFKELRHAHSAVESNINMLEHHGLNRCMDKDLYGYRRCIGLSVLAYNLHQLGNVLLAKERKEAEKKQGHAARAA